MAATDGAVTEVEWQFNAVDVRPVARWLDQAVLPGVTIAPAGIKRLNDAYFDTASWRMHRAGYTCRLRWDGTRGELTLKSMADPDEGIRTREEVNQGISDPAPESFVSQPGPAVDMLAPLIGREPLRLLFALETERRLYNVADAEGTFGEIALDTTTIPVGDEDHPVRLSRVEVEVPAEGVDRARAFVSLLAAEASLSSSGTSKFEAALLATGLHPEPAFHDLGPTDIHADQTIGEVAFAILRRQFAIVVANEAGTRLGRDIEELHDMRVAARRMRAAMSQFRPYLSTTARALEPEIRWLQRALGPVRDLDVQIEHLDQVLAGPMEQRDDLIPYRDLLIAQRDRERKRLLTALDSRRYRRLVERFAALLPRGPARTYVPGRVAAPIVARDTVVARRRKLRKLGDRISRASAPEEYHAARIEAKKLRYAVEFFEPIYGRRAAEFATAVKQLQDVLGDHQDAMVAMETLRRHAQVSRKLPPATILAMGAMAEGYRLEAAELRSRFPRAYKALTGRTWRRLQERLDERAAGLPDPRKEQVERRPAAGSSKFGGQGDENVDMHGQAS
ncbi:MAG: CHAD domain-containing protein [Dehalococcoidia bacterium]|nr:CHAD domain-containing protein [Dehalococcoidia bacterium]